MHSIDVQGHEHIRQDMRRYAPKILEAAQLEVDKMLNERMIEPSNSSWCIGQYRKPNGKYRFCIDFRKVNEVTEHDAVAIQNSDELLHQFQGAIFFPKLDSSQAFFHIDLNEKSREMIAFVYPEKACFNSNEWRLG